MNTAEQRIDALDLGIVHKKLTLPNMAGGYEWPQDEVAQAISAYRQFLKEILHYRSQDPGTLGHGPIPDPVVDIVWHTHILFTRKYHQDCADIFGEYIHHQPRLESSSSGTHNPVPL